MVVAPTPYSRRPKGDPAAWARYFDGAHPLYEVADVNCQTIHRALPGEPCPGCWEQAIRADERVAVEEQLGEHPDRDPFDESAVIQAADLTRELPVPLYKAVRDAAARVMVQRGMTFDAVAERLGLGSHESVRQMLGISKPLPRTLKAKAKESVDAE